MIGLHPLLGEIFHEWNRQNLHWALLRLPSRPEAPAGDIDLLIHPGDFKAALRSLEQHGFSSLPHFGYAPDHFYLAYHRPTDHWLWLHLTSVIAFGPLHMYRTDTAPSCLARRRAGVSLSSPAVSSEASCLSLLDPVDEFWVLLLHCLLDKRSISTHHRARLRDLAGRLPGGDPFSPLLPSLTPPGCSPAMVGEWARLDQWAAIEDLIPTIENSLRQKYPVTRAWLAARRAGRLVTRCLNVGHPLLWRRYMHRARARRRSSALSGGQS